MDNMHEIEQKFIRNGKLTTIPKKSAAKLQILAWFQQKLLDVGNSFTEKELNAVIQQYYLDYAIIRRYLVDYQFVERDKAGTHYTILLKEQEQ